MSTALRNSLWNVFNRMVWNDDFMFTPSGDDSAEMDNFTHLLWDEFFKLPTNSRMRYYRDQVEEIEKLFFALPWHQVYDFLEFIVAPSTKLPKNLSAELNRILERETSGYRIVAGTVVDVTSEQEVKMLDAAIRDDKFAPVASHLKRALELLAHRENPDYRNSIKESISAVESMAKIVANNPKATLGQALKVLEKNGQMHASLKEGFQRLYGYASDEDGIRHAMLDEPNLTAADAKYFLMSCTSFVNYMKARQPA